jgi:photosystem II stability/assembly factor-like uncharacterized protein
MKKYLLLSILCFSIIALQAQKLDMNLMNDMKPRNIGPAGMSGRVTAIAVNLSNTNIIFAGTASGGIWKSSDEGTSWTPIFEDKKAASIGALAIYQKNPDIIWAGTGEGNPRNSVSGGYGLYKSIDGGRSWKDMGLHKTRHIHRIITHPDNPDIVYVGAIGSPWGAHPERGVYKTTDGGKTWDQILFTNEYSGVADMDMDPSNPDKIFVAMWQHHRQPWFFKSGGEGSGLYMTVDGGQNWKLLSDKDGLPKGEIGRIGLAISKSNPEYVYALVESNKNAIYRSTDGGYTWEKRGDKNIGDRPFYYADIFVDSKNENRVYSLYSFVNVSEDGAKTFTERTAKSIHSDHHAWWIHPENSSFMIDGNDGGMAITHDMGKTWRLISNLPVGQFYHVNVDNERPYNIYGGMQDNGSWVGPAYVWSNQGIINNYWNFLNGGDGFDAVPIPGDSRYCYSMSQQGNLSRNDILTGDSKMIKPVHPEGIYLRFNWNAAIAQNPFNANSIYFGSQFLHKSNDRGENWDIISPDLTTNDPEKQKQNLSGGLTIDATGAENYTTIISIAPSSLDEKVIWVGTDDGNLQLTKDGGSTWENVYGNIKGAPKNAWIPQIHPSRYNAAEAFVVVNNYRQNDYKAYLYHTTDFGKKWEQIADESQIWGYALSFEQDPIEPKLMFLGSEMGLYVSLDAGDNWTKWTNGYPTVSTMDMKIQSSEYDLVIGTFGRSIWVLDDIRPLRKLAQDGMDAYDKEIIAFEPPAAVIASAKVAPGYPVWMRQYAGDAYYEGENRKMGAMISFYVKEGSEKDKVSIEIIDSKDEIIRTLTVKPKTGINRIYWGFDSKGFRIPGQPVAKEGEERGGGPMAFPGVYTLKMKYKESESSTQLTVDVDNRLTFNEEAMLENRKTLKHFITKAEELNKALDQLKEIEGKIDVINKLMPKESNENIDTLKIIGKNIDKSIKEFNELMYGPKDVQGISRNPEQITNKLEPAYSGLFAVTELNTNQKFAIDQAEKTIVEFTKKLNMFFDNDWKNYQEAVTKAKISIF